MELTRSDYGKPDPRDLVYNGGYLEDLVGVRRFLLNSTRHEPASFHAHVDYDQHPVEPSIGGLLGEGALNQTVVKWRKGLNTYEIRGLFPPILADGTIDPAMLADVFTFYSQVALAKQEAKGAINLHQGQEESFSVEQLIFGHVANFVENPLARLALLHILQRDMQRTTLLHRADPNARHFSVFEAINPLNIALSYDLSRLDVLAKVFSKGERQTPYIQNRVLLLDLVQRNRMTDPQAWDIALKAPSAIIGRLGKQASQNRNALLQFVRSGDGELVKPAVDCLAQDAQTVRLLIPVLDEDFGPETTYLQREILDSIHQYVSPSEYSRLYKSFFISHSSEAVRTRALRYLIDDPNQKEYLYTLLDEPSFSYEDVAKILRSFTEEDLPHVGPRVEQIFHTSMYDEVRSSAIRLLAKDFDTYGDLLMNVLMDEIKQPQGGGEYIISDVVGILAQNTKHLEFLADIIHTEQKVNGQVTSNYNYAEDSIVYGLVAMTRRNFNLTDDEKNTLMDIAKTVLKRHRKIEALDLVEKVLVGATEEEIERFAAILELGTGTWDAGTEGDLRFRFNRYNFSN
ncbi:MAG TPA: hypothetical protein VFQ63_01605 [Patescibacteria group bacterium]|nr:hypothetical protein [Patescibacteria group bacterium]